VEIWCARLEELELDAGALSEDERARAARYRFDRDRERFVKCRALLRRLLAERVGCGAGEVRFALGEHGKPRLEPPCGWEFNVSNSGGRAAYVLARGRRTGVDIEQVRPGVELDAIAARFLPPGESERLAAMEEGRRLEAFFESWTRWEAYVKALGAGLSLPPGAMEPGWTVSEIDAGAGFKGTVVIEGECEVPAVQWAGSDSFTG
jgi:4'-phosphopantetheinyl transferase